MLNRGRAQRGVTLIELLVVISIAVLLAAAAVPSFGTFTANARLRTTAESLQNSLRLAQAEAIQRSRRVVLALTNATPAWDAQPADNGAGWFVRQLPLGLSDEVADATYLVQSSIDGRLNSATITGPALVCFNSLGQQITLTATQTGMGAGCTQPTGNDAKTQFTVANVNATRSFKVQVSLGGRVRMCDANKTLSADNPDGC